MHMSFGFNLYKIESKNNNLIEGLLLLVNQTSQSNNWIRQLAMRLICQTTGDLFYNTNVMFQSSEFREISYITVSIYSCFGTKENKSMPRTVKLEMKASNFSLELIRLVYLAIKEHDVFQQTQMRKTNIVVKAIRVSTIPTYFGKQTTSLLCRLIHEMDLTYTGSPSISCITWSMLVRHVLEVLILHSISNFVHDIAKVCLRYQMMIESVCLVSLGVF